MIFFIFELERQNYMLLVRVAQKKAFSPKKKVVTVYAFAKVGEGQCVVVQGCDGLAASLPWIIICHFKGKQLYKKREGEKGGCSPSLFSVVTTRFTRRSAPPGASTPAAAIRPAGTASMAVVLLVAQSK